MRGWKHGVYVSPNCSKACRHPRASGVLNLPSAVALDEEAEGLEVASAHIRVEMASPHSRPASISGGQSESQSDGLMYPRTDVPP